MSAPTDTPTARFLLDGVEVPFDAGDTVLAAATRAGHYVPHLCWLPDFAPHGSCRVCSVQVQGRTVAACTLAASEGMKVQSNTETLQAQRKTLLQMLFVEGNHFCPSCEKSGNCRLQATAYEVGMLGPHFEEFYPDRPVDASHPDILLDFNRCILCELCVRASHEVDGKNVFAIGGHGVQTRLLVNSDSGLIEGGLCNAENVVVLREFRAHCKTLVAVGACAITGGLPAQRNHMDVGDVLAEVYRARPGLSASSRISAVSRNSSRVARTGRCRSWCSACAASARCRTTWPRARPSTGWWARCRSPPRPRKSGA